MGGPELALNKHHYPRARARAQQVWVAGVQGAVFHKNETPKAGR